MVRKSVRGQGRGRQPVRAAPTLPGASRVRLPSAASPCCDTTAMKVSHLHSSCQLLTAHVGPDSGEEAGNRVRTFDIRQTTQICVPVLSNNDVNN